MEGRKTGKKTRRWSNKSGTRVVPSFAEGVYFNSERVDRPTESGTSVGRAHIYIGGDTSNRGNNRLIQIVFARLFSVCGKHMPTGQEIGSFRSKKRKKKTFPGGMEYFFYALHTRYLALNNK